ncbi:MAG: M16 family metallopeptidase, partial [Longimicrobiales bacterium]
VRDGGLAHLVDAGNYTPEEIGVFNVSLETTPALTLPALRASVGVLRRAADAVEDGELARVRTITRARLLRRMETVEGQANLLADWQALGNWEMVIPHYRQLLETDGATLRDVAARYLDPAYASLLIHAPRDAELPSDADEMKALLFDGAAPPAGAPDASERAHLPTAPAGAKAEFAREDDGVRFYRSAEGAHIVVLPRPGTGLVSMAIAAPGGACAEPQRHAGITTMVARTALKGTQHYTAATLAGATELLGGSIAPTVGSDDFGWTLSVPARNAESAFALLAEAALHPTFPAEELERERSLTLAQLAQMRDDMYRYPLRLCLAAAFPRHPYGHSLESQESALATLQRTDLVAWHHGLINQSNAWCFVVGDVEADAFADVCAQHLAAAGAAKDEPPCAIPAKWPASPARAVVRRPRAQTALSLAFPGPRHGETDADALALLGSAIGGLGGRLFEELRSRQSLAYTVSAAPLPRRHGGSFHAYIATSPEREDEARDGLLRELGRLRTEPIGADELDRARRFMIGARRIRRQTGGAQLSDLMTALLIGSGLEELRTYEKRLMAFDTEALRAAAERWLDEARVVEGVVRGAAASGEEAAA